MKLVMKIAWRNILRHKGKSVIIGIIIFTGSFIMTAGNGVIAGMDRGLEKNIVNGFTGHAVIIPEKETSDNVLFKFMGKSVEVLSDYSSVKRLIDGLDFIDGQLPVGKNPAIVINEEDGEPGFIYLIGTEFNQYSRFFRENLSSVEGSLPAGSGEWILMPLRTRKLLYDSMNIWFVPLGERVDEKNLPEGIKAGSAPIKVKDKPVFMGFSENNSASDVRVPVRGIIRYRALNPIWGHFAIIDIESYRRALGYFSASEKGIDIRGDRKKLLDNSSPDSLFGSESLVIADSGNKNFMPDFSRKPLATAKGPDLETGAYNLVFVKFKKDISAEEGTARLNEILKSSNMQVRAVTWKQASGPVGNMTTIIKGALFMFVSLLFIVAVIIIVNTLTMATIERVPEIGMMRAIGAGKVFIGYMFIGETGILSCIFGGAGILLGLIVVKLTPMFGITSDNDMIQLLFGGDIFTPVLSANDLFFVIFQLALVTFVTVIYPVKVASGITPLDAIARD